MKRDETTAQRNVGPVRIPVRLRPVGGDAHPLGRPGISVVKEYVVLAIRMSGHEIAGE